MTATRHLGACLLSWATLPVWQRSLVNLGHTSS